MRIIIFFLLAEIFLIPGRLHGQKLVHLFSPDGKLSFSFRISHGSARYNVLFKGTPIVAESGLGLQFANGEIGDEVNSGRAVFRNSVEDYELPVGKTRKVHDPYKEVTIPIIASGPEKTRVNLVVRAFNGGLAFRYEIPQQATWTEFTLLDENTNFRIPGNPMVHSLMFGNYTSSHEGIYQTVPFLKLREDTLLDLPVLLEFPKNIYVGITEAELVDYAGMYLSKRNDELVSRLSPWPHQTSIKVKSTLPHNTPWRVLLISDRIGDLIESNIITDLNEPCKIPDLTWLKPGKTTFPWWNGNVTPDTLNAPGNNFVTNRYYIDFCARNHLEYHSVVEYGLHQWYVDDGVNFQPGAHADVTTPVPGLDMAEICSYAKSKGVGVRVWVHFYALYPKLDTAFALFEKWGLKGMMVDFMDRDDQQMVNMQVEILQKAAAHHLHIQFHGAYKPTGLSRTYPNEFTREGTLNYEADKWNNEGISPDHDINMPFTRMLAGSTDYHLGGFRAVPQSTFRAQYTRPLVLGTRCHMLAMYVVLENYLQMVCDYPAAYEGEAGFEFITQIPTVWDETKVLEPTKAFEYITIARRKNNDWYLGTITNHAPRTLKIPMSFLGPGTYLAEIYTDADDANKNPNHLERENRAVTAKDTVNVQVSAGGGMAMKITMK
ncbi:MAG TPA: glycoside hydrolase family 97 protein [Puia sp.]|nr:glycoside hydrolase family 97 protein [Puia sp.]